MRAYALHKPIRTDSPVNMFMHVEYHAAFTSQSNPKFRTQWICGSLASPTHFESEAKRKRFLGLQWRSSEICVGFVHYRDGRLNG